MKHLGCGLLNIVLLVWTGWGFDAPVGPTPQPSRTSSRAPEGDLNFKMPVGAPGEGLPDANQLPPMKLVLRANDSGLLASTRLNQKSFARGDWGALRGYIIGILGDERGPNSIQARAEIEIDFDHNLRYKHMIDAITAVSGYVDENDKVVKFVEKIKFSPRERSALAEPAEAKHDERVSLPRSELARTPEFPYEEPIPLVLTKSGAIHFRGETLAMDAMADRMSRERRITESIGKTASDATVVIRADKDCPTGKIQKLIKICQGQGFERFALRVRVKQLF